MKRITNKQIYDKLLQIENRLKTPMEKQLKAEQEAWEKLKALNKGGEQDKEKAEDANNK